MDSLDQYYLDRWDSKSNWIDIGPTKRKRLENLLYFLGKYSDNTKTIKLIDYGCGSGWLFHYLKEFGINELYGFDVTPSTLKVIREEYPFVRELWCKTGDFPTEIPQSYFNFCTSIEVIEHVPFSEKSSYLRELNAILSDGGYLYLTTPNGKYFKTGIKEYEKQPIEDWCTPSQMLALLKSNGFVVIAQGSISFRPNLSLFHKLILRSRIKKLIKYFGFESSLFKLMDKHFLGLSTYFFCQKKR